MRNRAELMEYLRGYFNRNSFELKIEMAFLFGSWGRGVPREDSDIDIAVVFSDEPVPEEEAFRRLTDISVLLSRDLKCDVNVILVDRNFKKPLLYYNAVALGLPLFVRDTRRYIWLKNEALYQMEDFSLFGIGWQYRAAEKNLEVLKHA